MKAEYIQHMGTDLTVVNAARVSFDKESDWDVVANSAGEDYVTNLYTLSDRDRKLIRYLASHGHWTPFAHPHITFRITAPIFVARQAFKHKVGFTENEVSRRYVDDTPTFYLPEVWRGKPLNAKQGSSDVELTEFTLEDNEFYPTKNINESVKRHYQDSALLYESLVNSGVAPEQARMVLPQAMYTSWYWTGSLAAWARFFKQRTDPHAQLEINALAQHVGPTMETLFPVSWEALVGHTE